MRRYIKKLFYSSVMVIVSIGISFNTEARVTKEVAEVTLPYLMEAAGIPGDPHSQTTIKANVWEYENIKIQAILDMIYTDEGQQQMVKWSVKNERPAKLAIFGGLFNDDQQWKENSSNKEQDQEKIFQTLFPCNTNTFTSFAANSNRLGYYALKYGLVELVGATVLQINQDAKLINDPKVVEKERKILTGILESLNGSSIDLRMAKIIFLLDICDTLGQLKDIYNKVTTRTIATEMDGIPTKYNEYDCRPISATMAQRKNNKGDCVENLCRHIIAIASQVGVAEYCSDQLPSSISLKGRNQSGITEIQLHKDWSDNLKDTYLSSMTINSYIQEYMINFIKLAKIHCFKLQLDKELKRIADNERNKISNGTFENLVDVIESIAFYYENLLRERSRGLCQRLAAALNKISNGHNKFEISEFKGDASVLKPSDTNTIIKIKENSNNPVLNRTILIAFCKSGHAEILSIQKS